MVSENKHESLKSIMELLEKDELMAIHLWKTAEFQLVVLQVLTDAFHSLSFESISKEESDQVRICLEILRSMVAIPEFKEFFLRAQLDYYIYPFILLPTDESLRISTLGLFCAVLHGGIPERMRSSELLPLLLKVVDSNVERLQLLSLEALDLIMQGSGLEYAVQTLDRFQAMDIVLSALMSKSIYAGNGVLMKKLLKIYLRFCQKSNVRLKLKEKLPEGITSKEAMALCASDEELAEMHKAFMKVLS